MMAVGATCTIFLHRSSAAWSCPAALHDASSFHHENLVGAANGGETVRDDEGRAALHQVREAFLNHGLRFGIEAGGRFVEDQNARIGQDGARDRDSLPLAAGELDAALADDGVVLQLVLFGELVHARDGGRREGSPPRSHRVWRTPHSRECCRRRETSPASTTQLRAIGLQTIVERSTPSTSTRPSFGLWKAAIKPMIVDLPEPDDPTRRLPSRPRVERDVVQNGLLQFIGEVDVLERDIATDRSERDGAIGVFVLGNFIQDFAGALQAGNGFGDLRADADNLDQRRCQVAQNIV
jgi:hypothetical protein